MIPQLARGPHSPDDALMGHCLLSHGFWWSAWFSFHSLISIGFRRLRSWFTSAAWNCTGKGSWIWSTLFANHSTPLHAVTAFYRQSKPIPILPLSHWWAVNIKAIRTLADERWTHNLRKCWYGCFPNCFKTCMQPAAAKSPRAANAIIAELLILR